VLVSAMPTPELIKFPTRETRKLLRRLRLRRAGIRREVDVAALPIGGSHRRSAPMAVHPGPLHATSVVYSFGIGRNVDWDVEMIERFGVTVHAFDPAPGTAAWVESLDLPDGFIFHPVGLGAMDGTLRLYPSSAEDAAHFSVVNRGRGNGDGIDAPVKTLASIAAMLGHARVDVVKMDVEGAEYDLMPSVMEAGVPIGQIALELHHNFPTLGFEDTASLVALLRRHGYRVFHVSQRGRELSFVYMPDQPAG
jgi:FkbM family methyltransferase